MDSYKNRIIKSIIGETILGFALLDILYLTLDLEKMISYLPVFMLFFAVDIVYNIVQLRRVNYHETFGLSLTNFLMSKPPLLYITLFIVVGVFIYAFIPK